MPLPKRRHSKQRGRKRRTHWKLTAPNLVECPHCHEMKLSHRVCLHCGFYDGEEVLVIKKKEKT
ncbi:MAG: 50S ribosomal protein L32 [candidate division WOR-3 bacterium]|nr:50S ribosomal protein L32 [candidate division WOR-3 bacterium]